MITSSRCEDVGDDVEGLAQRAPTACGKACQIDQTWIFRIGHPSNRRELCGLDAGELGGFCHRGLGSLVDVT